MNVPALFPGTTKAREQVFGVGIRDAMAVIGDLNGLQAAELVVVKHHVDMVGIGIDCVPYQLGNSEDRLADL